jgi:hypothetical protein
MSLDIKEKIKSLKSIKENKHLVAGFILIVCVSIYYNHIEKPDLVVKNNDQIFADTILPKGYILFPIRLENIEAIQGVIHQFGIIDVYTANQPGRPSKKVLSKVKILQAPYNPNEYALLLAESLSSKMMTEVGPFLGVIQNRSVSTDITEAKPKIESKNIHIEYQQGI